MSWTDRIGTIINIAHGLTKHGTGDGADAAGAVLIQKGVATNGHLHLCTLNKVHRWIELLELVKSWFY